MPKPSRFYRNAFEIYKQVLGDTHPSTATSYNNVASNLNAQGRYAEAEPLYHKGGLRYIKQALGDTHPNTAASYNNVAANLDAIRGAMQGGGAASPQGALRYIKQALGDTHHDTGGRVYNNIALNLDAQGALCKEAEPLFRKGLEISTQVLGEDASRYGKELQQCRLQPQCAGALRPSRATIPQGT